MKTGLSIFILLLTLALVAPTLTPVAEANLSARYGRLSAAQYRTSLPIDARRVFIGRNLYYLSGGVYYQPAIYQGRTVYVPVDITFQHGIGAQN